MERDGLAALVEVLCFNYAWQSGHVAIHTLLVLHIYLIGGYQAFSSCLVDCDGRQHACALGLGNILHLRWNLIDGADIHAVGVQTHFLNLVSSG